MTLLLLFACPNDGGIVKYNEEPSVTILNPISGTQVNEGSQVDFQAKVKDDTTTSEELTIQWESSIDGALDSESMPDSQGNLSFSTSALGVGNHTITLRVLDKEGEEGSYNIELSVLDLPEDPTIAVIHPIPGESGVEDEPYTFSAQVGDEQDVLESLIVTISSSLLGTEPFCTAQADAVGVAECNAALGAGDHTLTFAVTDSDSLVARAQIIFPVVSKTSIDDDGDGFSEDQGDCDDDVPSVNPLGSEVCNQLDDNCSGVVDEGTECFDDDFDGQRESDGDCDDDDPNTYLGAPETCDNEDNDCDFVIDETTQCYDDDGDGLTEIYGDCNDASAVSYPLAPELEDGLDNDCDGIVDEGTNAYDDDFDGYSENAGDCDDTNANVSPGVAEMCDGLDNNCDGVVDEENASGCANYYYDYDGDGYGSSSVGGKCLCYPDGYYTSPYSSDCYDYNANASPSATVASTSHVGNGSYDWNCDGQEVKQDTSAGSCTWTLWSCQLGAGWESSPPSCGNSGNYIYDCDLSCFADTCCDNVTYTATQACL
jgi:hypothetical protein